jgi:hypothetical protein
MIIEHLKGKNICENFEEAIEVLNFRTKQGVYLFNLIHIWDIITFKRNDLIFC